MSTTDTADDEAPDRAAPQDPDRPWSGREETDRVTHGFPPWRRLDEPVPDDPEMGTTPDELADRSEMRDLLGALQESVDKARASSRRPVQAEPDTGPYPGGGEGIHGPGELAEPDTWPEPNAEERRSLLHPETEEFLGGFASGDKASVKDLRPAVRAALDELARLRGEVARSRLAGVEHPAPEPESAHDISAEWNMANERDRARAERDDALATNEHLRTQLDEVSAELERAREDRDNYKRAADKSAIAAANRALRAERSDTLDRDSSEHKPRDEDEMTTMLVGEDAAYDRGWSDAIADAIGNRIWAGAPLAWRHVHPGDVVLTDPDEGNPAGVAWIVDANDEARGTFARKVTLRGAGTRADAELDPDTTATVLLPAGERAAIVALRTGLDARIGDRS